MQAFRAVKRLQGTLPRWGGAQNVGSSIEECLNIAACTLVDAPSMPFMLNTRTRTLTSAAMSEPEPEDQGSEQIFEIQQDDESQLEILEPPDVPSIMNLPDSIDAIGRLNPELREAMEKSALFSISGETFLASQQQLAHLVAAANGNKETNITKTALKRLRIDQLRSQLVLFGADSRGTKEVLVKRILDLIEAFSAADKATGVAAELGEGLVSGKQMARASQLRGRAGLTHDKVGVSEAQLQESQHATITQATEFSKVFSSPHEIARLLVEARAEDIQILDVRGNCTFTDYMVLATGRSSQIVHILADAVLYELKKRCKEVAPGVAPAVEGREEVNAQWLVVDAGSIVVHIFAENARKEFDLEGLWGGKNNVTHVATPQRMVNTVNTIKAVA